MNEKKLSVIGAGPLTFDIIMKREYPEGFIPGKRNRYEDKPVKQELGSNTGNVMCILGYFGWESYPIALLGDDPVGRQMKIDFERYHCNTRFVTNSPEGGSNIFSITHKLDKDGTPAIGKGRRHAVGSGFPRDKALGVRDALPRFIEALDFVPDVYFFSNASAAGWRELGKHLRRQGTLVYFEQQDAVGNDFKQVLRCMKEADIVKFSDVRLPDLSFADELQDKLLVQTLGANGLRFNLLGKGWVELPPVRNDHVVDTEEVRQRL